VQHPLDLSRLDAGIRRAVELLREGGVETFESCEGGWGHSFYRPTVKFYGTTAAGWRALAVCKDSALPVRTLERVWDLEEGEPSGPYWQIVFRERG
jgi:hypothetical protein